MKKGSLFPRWRARAASTGESIPEISDRASRSTRNRETNPTESLCSLGAPAEQCPRYTIRAEHSPDRSRHACTASAFLRGLECLCGAPRDFLSSAQPSISGLAPRRHQGLLPRHFHSGKRSL
jgi:hypothetical protein